MASYSKIFLLEKPKVRKGDGVLLKMSSRTRLVSKLISKLIMSVLFGSVVVLSLMFMKYKFVYSVEINQEDVGYVASKSALEKEIDNYIINGDAENVGYVVMNAKVDYNMLLVNKNISTEEEKILAMVKDKCDVYYRVYSVLVDGKEKSLVDSLESAQKIIDGVNEKQSKCTEKATLEIEEKYLTEYEVSGDVEVAVNTIFEPIKKVNDAIKEIRVAPAAQRTVSNDVLLALKENLSDLDFELPVRNPVITSRFGLRTRNYHSGIDLACPTGTPIAAAEDGVVTFADWSGNYGYLVKVQHTGGYETYYAHCSKILTSVGTEVKKGDVLANVGSTGRSTGPHLHLEIRYNGSPLNPEVFIYD